MGGDRTLGPGKMTEVLHLIAHFYDERGGLKGVSQTPQADPDFTDRRTPLPRNGAAVSCVDGDCQTFRERSGRF